MRFRVDYDSPAVQEQTVATYHAAGIRISGIGVVGMQLEMKSNRRFFEFARRADCRSISCSVPPQVHEEILRGAAALADEFDVVVAIHNHGGSHWLGNSITLQYVLENDRPPWHMHRHRMMPASRGGAAEVAGTLEPGKLEFIESAVVEFEGDHAAAQSRECVRAIRKEYSPAIQPDPPAFRFRNRRTGSQNRHSSE